VGVGGLCRGVVRGATGGDGGIRLHAGGKAAAGAFGVPAESTSTKGEGAGGGVVVVESGVHKSHVGSLRLVGAGQKGFVSVSMCHVTMRYRFRLRGELV